MTDAHDAPERIWATSWTGSARQGKWSASDTSVYAPCTEYIREDIHKILQTERHADAEYIAKLEAELAAARAALAPQWREISRGDLKQGDQYLVYHAPTRTISIGYWDDEYECWHDGVEYTHWMPEPQPPEDGQ